MTLLYRGILPNAAGDGPLTGDDSGDKLGVRDADVTTYDEQGAPWVSPTNAGKPQGMSVSPDSGCNLPRWRRPAGQPWNGTNKKVLVWQLDSDDLVPAQLSYVADPGNTGHGFISPGVAMSLSDYRDLVHATAALWTTVDAPPQPCPSTGGTVSANDERAARIDAVAAGAAVDRLVEELLAANAAGLSGDAVVAELEAGVDRAEDAGQEDGAEVLRTLLDRVTGFCGPHARIDLE
ncbi:hypothetical protein [Umezawaea beigongshangensis]|uniref:Tse2 family ADP-ribosyltransferase toxin n=1 Tax=Umezawaea beigongshangensis TaxID=2780383 RepID=UPI003F687D59